MSSEQTPPEADPLPQGVLDFYSSQAEVLLAQYENINQLLGPTNDWTHPGTHCEILIREFLRRHLPGSVRVDKGYIWGRVEREGTQKHSPEVDIIVHDVLENAPIFRLEDFVIVQARDTRAMIQVKRRLNRTQCGRGIKNVTESKHHLVRMLTPNRRYVSMNDVAPRYSAVIGIEDDLGVDPEQFTEKVSQLLRDWARQYPPPPIRPNDPLAVSMLPQFVGTLTGHFAVMHSHALAERSTFSVYKSILDRKNVALQALLSTLLQTITRPFVGQIRPFYFPPTMIAIHHFVIEQQVTRIDSP